LGVNLDEVIEDEWLEWLLIDARAPSPSANRESGL